MSRGISQDSSIGHPVRLLGKAKVEIRRCNDCPRFLITICQETGRKIKYPISGPIPEDCRLPKKKMVEDTDP